MGSCPSSPQPSVREPRENRGRLRHCNGLRTPTATGLTGREGGSKASSSKSGYQLGCARHGPPRTRISGMFLLRKEADFSVKEKDEASPRRECASGFVECLHSP